MPYFFFMKHPMCLSVRREGRGRREKGPELLVCAATSSLQAEPLLSWGSTRTAPRSSAWPFPMVHPGRSHGTCWVPTALADLSCVPKGHLQGMDLGGTWLGAWGLLLLLHSALWLSLSQEQPRLDNTGHPKLMPKSLMKKQHLRKAEREERGPCTGTWQQAHLKERSNV